VISANNANTTEDLLAWFPIERFPLDIGVHIFEQAISDSPFTYQSLLCTSRKFSLVLESMQAMTLLRICLTTELQLSSFLWFLRSRPKQAEYVRHLWVKPEAHESYKRVFNMAVGIIKRCPCLVSLGFNVDVLARLQCLDSLGSVQKLSLDFTTHPLRLYSGGLHSWEDTLRKLSSLKDLHLINPPFGTSHCLYSGFAKLDRLRCSCMSWGSFSACVQDGLFNDSAVHLKELEFVLTDGDKHWAEKLIGLLRSAHIFSFTRGTARVLIGSPLDAFLDRYIEV
jgi:hypothetical protein